MANPVLQFWWAVLKQAVLRADAHETSLAWLGKLVALIVALLSPTLFEAFSETDVPTWLQWSPIIGYVLLVAPYGVWYSEHARAERLQDRLTPRLALSTRVVPFRNHAKLVGQIRVANTGQEWVRNCTGRLLALYSINTDGTLHPRQPSGFYLRWSLGDGGGKLISFQSEAYLDVCGIEKPYQGTIVMTSVMDERRLFIEATISELARYVLRIEVAAENCGPVVDDYLCFVEPTGRHAQPDRDGGMTDVALPSLVLGPVATTRQTQHG